MIELRPFTTSGWSETIQIPVGTFLAMLENMLWDHLRSEA